MIKKDNNPKTKDSPNKGNEKHLMFVDEETGIICLIIDGVIYLKQPVIEQQKEVNAAEKWDKWSSNKRLPW